MTKPLSKSALQTSDVPCNLCGAEDAATIFEAGVAQINRVVRCRVCGLMFSSPRLRPPDVEVVRSHDLQLTRDAQSYDPGRFEKEKLQVRDFRDTLAELASLYPERGRLIEVGSGMGFLLRALREDGWDVMGLEPDQGLAEYANEQHGVNTEPATIEEAGIPDHSVDVVVMLHVIEHLPDPLGTLRAISRILKPGGHLVVETPRYDTLSFWLFKHRERSVRCDGHIYFFTTRTLQALLAEAGFDRPRLKYVGRSLTADRLLWNLGIMSNRSAIQATFGRLSKALGLQRLHFKINVRDMQRVLARNSTAEG